MAYQTSRVILIAKAILVQEQLWYYLTHRWEVKRVHTIPKGVNPKVNVTERLEFELFNKKCSDVLVKMLNLKNNQ